jgi:hypothetical protein
MASTKTESRCLFGLQEEVGWAIAAVGVCSQFVLRYVWRGGSFLNLSLYAAGEERMPFQGRVLMAWILHATAANPHLSRYLGKTALHLPAGIQDPFSLVMLVVDLLAMFVGLWFSRLSLEILTNDRRFSAWASFLFCYMAYFNLVIGYGIFMMPYDLLSLTFFTVAVWLIVTERKWLLTALCLPAALNRETSLFITVFYGLYTWFDCSKGIPAIYASLRRWLPALPFLALQIGIWLGVRFWVRSLFPPSPDVYIWQFDKNLLSLIKPPNWPLFFSLFGFTLPLFIGRFRLIGNEALANSTAVISVLWFAGMMIVGVIVEIRIFSELSAFLMPCIALILRNLLRSRNTGDTECNLAFDDRRP